jgi:hypothetical protein
MKRRRHDVLNKSSYRILALLVVGAIVLAFAGSVAAHGPNHFRADLQPFDSTGVTGKAELQVDHDGNVQVVVTAKGLEPGAHRNHIHMNASCAPPGGVLQGLTDLRATPAGVATAKSALDASAVSDLENRVIAVHALSGAIVACGEINPVP